MKIDYSTLATTFSVLDKKLPVLIDKHLSRINTEGRRGERGLMGLIGRIGPQGERGEKGEHGEAGSDGRGIPGAKGERGLTGKTGPKGLRGDSGERGFKGVNGEPGENGPLGVVGLTGEQGPKGDPGLPPEHEWIGTKLRFKNPDGTWGKLVELRGLAGRHGDGFIQDPIMAGELIVINSDYTTTESVRIVATVGLTVTLNANPANDETVFIKMQLEPVEIDGNGNLIDGWPTQIIDIEYTSLRLMFSTSLSEWLVT